MTTTLASLKRTDPLPPVPAGTYECWLTGPELRIVRVVRPTPNDFATLHQVWPPVAMPQVVASTSHARGWSITLDTSR